MEGWLLLHRKLGDSALWLEEPFTRGQAWVDLLMLAQHSPSHIRVQGMKINLKRGDVGESEVTLSLRWKWSRGKVRRFLEEIEKDGMVKKETSKMADRRKSVITICNYDSYQVFKKENGTGDGTGDGQATGRRRAGDGTGSTNDNECTNGKEVKAFCAEPQKDEVQAPQQTEPPLIVFSLSKIREEQAFYQNDIDQWRESFPGVDLRIELLKCRQWNIDNPTKRKTRGGIRTHISSWLGKAQNGQQGVNATSGRNSKVNVRDKAALLKSKTAEFLNGQNYIDNGENNESIGSGGNLLLEHQIP